MEENQNQAPPQDAVQAAPEQQQQQPQDAYQRRIDELVAQLKLKEAEAQQSAKLAMDLVTQQRTTQVQQATQDPLDAYRDKLDPAAIEAMRVYGEALEKRVAEKYRQLEANLGVRQIESTFANIKGVPPQVAQHAQQLYENARKQGFNPTVDEAINYAIGDHIRRGGSLAPVQPQPQSQPQYTPSVLPGVSPAPVAAQTKVPANFDSLTRQKQLEVGRTLFGDTPLF